MDDPTDRNLEREVKLTVDDDFLAPDLTTSSDGLVERSTREAVHVDSYYDTPELRLVRAGITVRSREEDGRTTWTVKLPTPDAEIAGGLTRLEVNLDGRAGGVPAEAARIVRARVRGGSLRLAARFRTVRRTTALGTGDRALALVDDDRVTVVAGIGKGQRFRELEVELTPEAPAELLDAVVDRLVENGARPGEQRPKLARALGPAAAEPADLEPVALGDDPTIGELVRAAITEHVRRLVDHDPVIRLDLDPEGVHQMRVATRRLRADLRTFRPVLNREWSDPQRDELRWLGRALGAVRDADVMLASLRGRAAELPDADRDAAERLLGRLREERATALGSLQRLLDGRRYRSLLDALVEAAAAPRFDPDADIDAAAKQAAPKLVARPWKKLRREVRDLDDEPADEKLHRVRIRAKRARYASEAAAAAIGRKADKLATRLSDLQDVLGELQDAVVAEAWLRDAAGGSTSEEALVAGLLVAREQAEADDRRASWGDVWARASRKKLASWLKR
ncbi:MAG: CHAD domain-containing protein [Acidimicrobiales bacterium]